MKNFLFHVLRGISCILLPIGAAYSIDALVLVSTGTRPFSISILIAIGLLLVLPLFIITSTPPVRRYGSNKRLIFLLLAIGLIPMFLAFGFTLIFGLG
jgi:hypothetical protein